MLLNPLLYSLFVGVILTVTSILLYMRLSQTAEELERKRLAREEKRQERVSRIKNLGWQEELKEEARKSGWSLSPKEYLFISGGSFLIMLIIGVALRNVFVALAGGLLAYALPRYIIKMNRKKEYKLKVRLLKPAIQAIASAHTFTPNIFSAIEHAVGSMQDPIKRDFELFLGEVKMGTPTKEALKGLRKRVNIKYLDFFIKVVSMAEDEGGSTHELIKTCAEIIDQDMVVMSEFEAEISAEKKTTYQLMFLQFVVLGFLSVSQPEAFRAFTGTLFGQIFVFYLLVATFFIYQATEKYTDTSLEEVQVNV